MTPYRVQYWVVEFQPRTAAIRALDSFPLKFKVYYVVPAVIPRPSKVWAQSSSAPLHLTRSLPETPPRLLLRPRSAPRPTPPLTPSMISLLIPPPVSALPPGLSPPDTTTSKTPALLAARWPARIGPESAASQYISRRYSASV